ncbi:MAG: transketolase [Longimicrobiales bacterium]
MEPMARPEPDLERLMIDTIRVLSMDAVQEANSGHPGTPMALAPLGYLVWTRHLKHNPADPGWVDRDRFVLSAGHASMLLYSLLHLTGYDVSLEYIKNFRQLGYPTPGHPEVHDTPGVETTTGPLGQGVANSVGMALAERWLASRFNRPGHAIIDHHTYVFCSDGDLMEGISHEAAELAGHQRLGKLIWVFDDNRITIEGSTDLASSTDHARRFESYGWHVQEVADGNDLEAMDAALEQARKETERPSIIVLRTTIGYGSPNLAGHHSTHGAPLGEDEIRASKENLGYPSLEPFHVEDEALEGWRRVADRGAALQSEWQERFAAYEGAHPDLARSLEQMLSNGLPEGWDAHLPDLSEVADPQATRASSGKVLQGLAKGIPNLLGGSADLGGSNKTDIEGADDLLARTPGGRIVHFGVREHGMGGIMNGMALHGGIRPFGGTFLIFSDYMRPSIRLAALMELPVVYVFTHDSIGLGEDGPTHQPVEHLMALRAVPNLMDLRPADPAETVEAWKAAVTRTDGPAFLSLTRQKVEPLGRPTLGDASGLHRGAYVLSDPDDDAIDVVLIASGSEVEIALESQRLLDDQGVGARVVSMPSWFLFQQQDRSYRDSVVPPEIGARISVEAGATLGWERWIGPDGLAVGLDRFGASAPYRDLFQRFGFTAESVADRALSLVRRAVR